MSEHQAPDAAQDTPQDSTPTGPPATPPGLVAPVEHSLAAAATAARGNAKDLIDYWTHGPGGAKIAWGTPGDFNRCVSLVREYLGGDAEGFCANRHKDALGIYPAQHK